MEVKSNIKSNLTTKDTNTKLPQSLSSVSLCLGQAQLDPVAKGIKRLLEKVDCETGASLFK